MAELTHLYLIDVSNYLFRSFYALPPMTNPKGQMVQAVFGLARALINLKSEFNPSHILAIFDGKQGKQKRQALYSEYKAHRVKAPQELLDQIPLAQEMCLKIGVQPVVLDHCEADDLIAAAVHQAQTKGICCTICSSDKDLLQLVGQGVTQLHTHKNNERIDAQGVEAFLGVKPHQVADWLALCGDSSDNIPGVPGIGSKTAAQLLEKYGSLEGIIEHLSELSPKRQESFDINLAKISYELAKLRDVPEWRLDFEGANWVVPQTEDWLPWFEQMGFRSLIKPLQKLVIEAPESKKIELSSTLNPAPLKVEKVSSRPFSQVGQVEQFELFDQFASSGLTSGKKIDTTNKSIKKSTWDEWIGYLNDLKNPCEFFVESITTSWGSCWLFSSTTHLHCITEVYLNEMSALNEALQRHSFWAYKIQDLERDWLKWGLKGPFHWIDDLHLCGFLHFADGRDIDAGALLNHFGVMGFTKWQMLEETINQGLSEAFERALEERVNALFELRTRMGLSLQPAINKLYREVELPFTSLLARLENTGVCVDPKVLEELSHYLHELLLKLEKRIFELCDTEAFNLNSPRQLAHVLYEKLQLPVLKKLKTGPSTSAQTLEELIDQHPVIAEILHYRELEKLRSTYVDALPSYIDPVTHLIHPHFDQTGTTTGRLSCREPNLQNIPVRSQEGLKIRRAFCVRKPHHVMVSADYSQIELRMMAHLSEDATLIEAFHRGEDIHRFTASIVFEIPLEEVSDEQRALAKAVNFGIMYGQQAFGLSRQLSIPMAKASAFIEAYFLRYPGVAAYVRACKKQALEEGYVSTLLGRRRLIPEMKSSKAVIRQLGERLCVNTPVQGGGADLIKLAMLSLEPLLKHYDALMILQVHDELIFECPEDQLEGLKKVIQEKMEGVYPLKVPLIVNIAVGKNWMEC